MVLFETATRREEIACVYDTEATLITLTHRRNEKKNID